MNCNQTNTTDISNQSTNKFNSLRNELLKHFSMSGEAVDKDRYQEDDKAHQPAQKPERTSEEKRLESLGYFF